MLIGAWMLWSTRKGRIPRSDRRWPIWLAVAAPLLPLAANSFGWIFTEMGRQPWIVFGLMRTEAGVSPNVGAGTVLTSMIVFTLLYGALAVVEVKLLLSAIKKGLPDVDPDNETGKQPEDKPMAFAY